jgi:hypothetical protein
MVLCPALVRSAMSPLGEDPAAVADDALAAVWEGRFAVVPDEWRDAVVQRAQRLISGQPPTSPTVTAGTESPQ